MAGKANVFGVHLADGSVKEMTYAELMELTGLSHSGVRNRVNRARAAGEPLMLGELGVGHKYNDPSNPKVEPAEKVRKRVRRKATQEAASKRTRRTRTQVQDTGKRTRRTRRTV